MLLDHTYTPMQLSLSNSRLPGVCLLVLALASARGGDAQTAWTGTRDSLFSRPANWSNGLPSATNAALIPEGARVVVDRPLDRPFDLESAGDLRLAAPANVRGAWRLRGTLATGPHRLTVSDTLHNFGRLEVAARGSVDVATEGVLDNAPGGAIENAGTIRVRAGGRLDQRADFDSVPGRAFVSGVFRTYAESVTTSEVLTVEPGGLLDVDDGGAFEVVFALVNAGRVRVHQPVIVRGSIRNTEGGTVTVASPGGLDFVLEADLENAGTFTNEGRIRTAGTLANDGVFVNIGELSQEGGGTIANTGRFTNKQLISGVERIVNRGTFNNFGRITEGRGGQIENYAQFTNFAEARLEGGFGIYNRELFVNAGYLTDGASLFNDFRFENLGFFEDAGDVVNSATGRFSNTSTGVFDNTDTGIFTNDGILANNGKITNGPCAVIANRHTIRNNRHLNNEGLLFDDGRIAPRRATGTGVLAVEGGRSPKIAQPSWVSLDLRGERAVDARSLAAPRFRGCPGLQYLIDGEAEIELPAIPSDTPRHVTLTLRDRRGNEVSWLTTLAIGSAPRVEVFPNPATETFTVALDALDPRHEDPVELVVTDPLGRMVFRRKVPRELRRVEVDAAGYLPGPYSVTIATDGFVGTGTVVVERE